MSTRPFTYVVAMAMAFGLIGGACSSGSGGPSGTGGTAGGGSGGGGGGASCTSVSPCGGGVTGVWTVTSSCLKVTGELDLSLAGAPGCLAPITGSLTVSGTWTANADGTYSDNTTTSGDQQFTLAPSCLIISSTPVTCEGAANIFKNLGYASLTCMSASGGGCACAGTVQQKGTLGLVSFAPATNGNYMTAGNVVTASGDAGDAKYSYCVSGNTMTMTPQSTRPTVTGTIGFQKSSMTGTGGTTGTAGTTGAGGTMSAAGTRGRALRARRAPVARPEPARAEVRAEPAQQPAALGGAAQAAGRRAVAAGAAAAEAAPGRAVAARVERLAPEASSGRATSTRTLATRASRPTAPSERSSERTAASSIRSGPRPARPRTS